MASEVPNVVPIRLADGYECDHAAEASLPQKGGPSQSVLIRLTDDHHDEEDVSIRLTDEH